MRLLYQHVGEELGRRDFPKTLGTPAAGLCRFALDDLATEIDIPSELQQSSMRNQLNQMAPDGFQVWGLPEGAERTLRDKGTGDAFLVLETIGDEGSFYFASRIIKRLRGLNPELSEFFWGESKFPIIVLLRGNFTQYRWKQFLTDIKYESHFDPRGKTYSVRADRLTPFGGPEGLVAQRCGVSI